MALSSKSQTHLANLVALLGLTLVSALIAALSLTTPYLTKSGSLAATEHTLLVTVVTIMATLFSTLIASRLRHLLLQKVDRELRQIVQQPNSGESKDSDVSQIDRRWRGILGIDNMSEKASNLSITMIYLFCGLITTAIVSTFTPISTVRTLRYHPLVPDAGYTFNETCVYMLNGTENLNRDYSWILGNGSQFYVPANAGGCPTRQGVTLAGNINTISPQDYAYSDLGVAVQPGAIGTPASVYSSEPNGSPALEVLLKSFGTALLDTTQCVPVMHKNPIRCRRGGSLRFGGPYNIDQQQQITVTSADGLCSSSWPFEYVNLTTDSVMYKFFCPASGADSIGKGTIVLSAIHAYDIWLAASINDRNMTANTTTYPNEPYVVTCEVDATDVFSYRKVTLDLQGSKDVSGISFARILSSTGAECEPVQPTISNIMFATAAAANWQPLEQNLGIDGWFETIISTAGTWRPPPYAFPNSQNGLEDGLGLVAALVVSRLNTSGNYVPAEDTGGEYAYVQAMRLGPGKREALLLLIPPLATWVVFAVLITKDLRAEQLDAGWRSGQKGEKQGTIVLYTESLKALIELGGWFMPAGGVNLKKRGFNTA